MSWAGIFRSSIVTRKAGPSRSPRSWLSSSRLAQRSSSPPRPPNAVAVHAAAPTIPLVFIAVADPVALGLVESLAHPGGNVTGFATMVPEGFVGKQLQFLEGLVPQASRIAVLINPTNPIHQREQAKLPEIGRLLGVELVVVEASKPDQLETAFETAHTQGAEAIHVFGDPLIFIHSAKVVGLAARYRLPAMYLDRRNVLDGGLMSYGPNTSRLLASRWRLRGQNPQGRETW